MRELTKEKRRKLERGNPENLTRRRELENARRSRLYRDESGKKHRMARREYDRQRPRDPEVLLHMRMYERERRQDDEKYHKMRFPTWVKRRTKTLKLQWKTHQPVEFDEKVEKQCVTCQRFRDMKFWCVIVSLFPLFATFSTISRANRANPILKRRWLRKLEPERKPDTEKSSTEEQKSDLENTSTEQQWDCNSCFYDNAGPDLMPIGYEGHSLRRPKS